MKYSSALERRKSCHICSMWTNLEDIILSEISQTLEDKHCMIPVISDLKQPNFTQSKIDGKWEVNRKLFNGIEFQGYKMKKSWSSVA
jgi:hypothetical protein